MAFGSGFLDVQGFQASFVLYQHFIAFFFLLLSLKKRQDVSSTLFTNLPACSTHPTWHREDQRAVSILFVVVNYKHHVVRQVPKTFYSHIT